MLQPDEMGLEWDRPYAPTYHSPLVDCPVDKRFLPSLYRLHVISEYQTSEGLLFNPRSRALGPRKDLVEFQTLGAPRQ